MKCFYINAEIGLVANFSSIKLFFRSLWAYRMSFYSQVKKKLSSNSLRLHRWSRWAFLLLSGVFWLFCVGLYGLGLIHEMDMLPRENEPVFGVWFYLGLVSYPLYLSLLLGTFLTAMLQKKTFYPLLSTLLICHLLSYWIFPPLLSWTVINVGAPVSITGAVILLIWYRSWFLF